MTKHSTVSPVKQWLVGMRPWSFPASVTPVLFGTALAVFIGGAQFLPVRFAAALLGMIALHAASNMISDAMDFRDGLDREPLPVSGAVVRGWWTPGQAVRNGLVLVAVGGGIGAVLAWLTGPVLWVIGGIGVASAMFYTRLKHHALGDLAVFLNFGLLGSLGAWVVQTGRFSWLPFLWAVPMSLLVIGILHANNWRDIDGDRARQVTTMAGIFGDGGSLWYYTALIFLPFVLVAVYMLAPRVVGRPGWVPMPWAFVLVFAALPVAVGRWRRAVHRRAPRRPMDFVILDGATAQLNLIFGMLCLAAVLLHGFLGW